MEKIYPDLQNYRPCTYCAGLQTAFPGSNFCSHYTKKIDAFDSNAFYFSGSNISSGPHVSRFSIRTVLTGYQSYIIDQKDVEIGPEDFIMIQEGQHFENNMMPDAQVQGLIISLSQKYLDDYISVRENSHEYLLYSDSSEVRSKWPFSQIVYAKSPKLEILFNELSSSIISNYSSKLYYFELFTNILDEIVDIHELIYHNIDNIQSQKQSTKNDLFQRLTETKTYIDKNLAENLTSERLAKVACMSPFHFLRSFTQLFNITPHQYVMRKRLKKAEYLLSQKNSSLEEVMQYTGFENKRTFQRSFAKAYGITPHSYHKERRSSR